MRKSQPGTTKVTCDICERSNVIIHRGGNHVDTTKETPIFTNRTRIQITTQDPADNGKSVPGLGERHSNKYEDWCDDCAAMMFEGMEKTKGIIAFGMDRCRQNAERDARKDVT